MRLLPSGRALKDWTAGRISLVRQSVLVRRSTVVFAGVAVAKGFALASLIILARLYSADDFGVLGLFQALVYVVSAVAVLTYPLAIPIPSEERDASALVRLSLLLACLTSILGIAIVGFLRGPLSGAMEAPELSGLLWWGPVLILALGAQDVLSHWLTRERRFASIAWLTASSAAAIAVGQIGAWVLGARSSSGLVIGLVMGTAVAVGVFVIGTASRDWRRLSKGASFARVRSVARAYWRFPAFHSPAALVSAASAATVPLGLGFLFGAVVVGFYWMAERLGSGVVNIIRESLQKVLLGRAAEVVREQGAAAALYRRSTITLGLFASPPALVVIAFGPELFQLLLGPDWLQAGRFARWLVFAWAASLVNIPALQFAPVYGLQSWVLTYTVVRLSIRLLGILFAWILQSPDALLAMHGPGAAACTGVFIWLMASRIRRGASDATSEASP